MSENPAQYEVEEHPIMTAPSNETLVDVLLEAKIVGVLAKGWKVRAVRTGHIFALYTHHGELKAFAHAVRDNSDRITVREFVFWQGIHRAQMADVPFLIVASRSDGMFYADMHTAKFHHRVEALLKSRGPELLVGVDFEDFKPAKGANHESA